MKNFLITGVNGFVASYFIDHLKMQIEDADVLGIDITETCTIDNINYKKVDLKNADLILNVLADFKPDYIVHLASISSVAQSWEQPNECFHNNTNIFFNIAEAIRKLGLKTKILSVGSSEQYGNWAVENMPLKETHELLPSNPYSVARTSQEMVSRLYANSYGLDVVMTRSFNHIGARQRDCFVISSFVKQLVEISLGEKENKISVGNIEIIRDFLDVRDVVDAYFKILMNGKSGEVYNVCSGRGVKLKEIIDIVSASLKISPEIYVDPKKIRPSDNMIIVGDNSKLQKELDWKPSYTLAQTLNDMIDYWRKELS